MEKTSTDFGRHSSDTASIASPKSKPLSYVVSNPLPESRISWLREQSRHVAAVSRQLLDRSDKG